MKYRCTLKLLRTASIKSKKSESTRPAVFSRKTVPSCLMEEVDPLLIDGDRLLLGAEIDCSSKFKKYSPLQGFSIILAHSHLAMVLEEHQVMLLQG